MFSIVIAASTTAVIALIILIYLNLDPLYAVFRGIAIFHSCSFIGGLTTRYLVMLFIFIGRNLRNICKPQAQQVLI